MICLVQEKAKVSKSLHDIVDTCRAILCLQHTDIFFTECGKSLSCLFLFYKEDLYVTPVREYLLMIRVFIPSLHFYFWKSISIIFLITTRAWPETAHITLDDTIFFLLEKENGNLSQ